MGDFVTGRLLPMLLVMAHILLCFQVRRVTSLLAERRRIWELIQIPAILFAVTFPGLVLWFVSQRQGRASALPFDWNIVVWFTAGVLGGGFWDVYLVAWRTHNRHQSRLEEVQLRGERPGGHRRHHATTEDDRASESPLAMGRQVRAGQDTRRHNQDRESAE